MKSAKESFSERSDEYANARPSYPTALFKWISKQCSRHDSAWDSATGSGQAAVGISPYFRNVYASDVSTQQIANAKPMKNIEYSVQPAEKTSYSDGTFDLIIVAQALHWFDFSLFWPEVSRVARKNAFFVAWGYDWLSSAPDVDSQLVAPFRSIISPYWAPNNKLLWRGYASKEIGFPFQQVKPPPFSLEMDWTIAQLIAYMRTWSAFKMSQANGQAEKSMDELFARTRDLFQFNRKLHVIMPLKIIAGRISSITE